MNFNAHRTKCRRRDTAAEAHCSACGGKTPDFVDLGDQRVAETGAPGKRLLSGLDRVPGAHIIFRSVSAISLGSATPVRSLKAAFWRACLRRSRWGRVAMRRRPARWRSDESHGYGMLLDPPAALFALPRFRDHDDAVVSGSSLNNLMTSGGRCH